MEEIYNCGEKIRENKSNQQKVAIDMSEIYSTSSLDSKRLMDYLKSQTSVRVKDNLKCIHSLKQKCVKKQKFFRQMKPYSRSTPEEPLESTSSMRSPIHSQSNFPSLEHKENQETKNIDNTKSLKITNPNGTTTEITLQSVVLMHVREIAAGSELNNKDKEIYQLGSVTPQQSLCQLNTEAKDSFGTSEPHLRVDCESQDHANTNVLKVKSSRNSTDLASERKLSCMKMSKNTFAAPENFRIPSTRHNARNRLKSETSSIHFSKCPNVCYHDQNSISDSKTSLDSFLVKLHDNNDNKRTYGFVKYQPQVNYSVTTFFRHPAPILSNTSTECNQVTTFFRPPTPRPSDTSCEYNQVATFFRPPTPRPSNTSSEYNQGETYSPKPSDMEMK